MRIAYIGNFQPQHSTENDVKLAFEHLGHVVVPIQENNINHYSLENVIYGCDMLLITSTWDGAFDLKRAISIFHECAKRNIPTVTLHLDTFWSTPRQGRQWWLNPMFHTAYIFTADGDYQDKWKAFGKNHMWMQPGFRHSAAHDGKYRQEYACDVAFIGSNGQGYHEDVWPDRKILVDNLRLMCSRNGWTFRNPGGDHPKVERTEDLNDFYASAKVTVGDSLCLKKEKSNYWSDRVPEATGRGGLLIMPWIEELSSMYDHKLPAYQWGDYVDLENQIRFYLENEDINQKVRRETSKITREKYTFVNVAQRIIEEVGL